MQPARASERLYDSEDVVMATAGIELIRRGGFLSRGRCAGEYFVGGPAVTLLTDEQDIVRIDIQAAGAQDPDGRVGCAFAFTCSIPRPTHFSFPYSAKYWLHPCSTVTASIPIPSGIVCPVAVSSSMCTHDRSRDPGFRDDFVQGMVEVAALRAFDDATPSKTVPARLRTARGSGTQQQQLQVHIPKYLYDAPPTLAPSSGAEAPHPTQGATWFANSGFRAPLAEYDDYAQGYEASVVRASLAELASVLAVPGGACYNRRSVGVDAHARANAKRRAPARALASYGARRLPGTVIQPPAATSCTRTASQCVPRLSRSAPWIERGEASWTARAPINGAGEKDVQSPLLLQLLRKCVAHADVEAGGAAAARVRGRTFSRGSTLWRGRAEAGRTRLSQLRFANTRLVRAEKEREAKAKRRQGYACEEWEEERRGLKYAREYLLGQPVEGPERVEKEPEAERRREYAREERERAERGAASEVRARVSTGARTGASGLRTLYYSHV
ncbi:hypothetical protein GGX14DRAFT_596957 [Mycena pura]|uniref:Uncharacterized protein n=1 Tax=Mycena pura TaxID=153505 RepID=A0AAD6UWC7_9AGAR|nr:hypothetical protein GGX14DRAFT_596957 [Mycena pura]